KWTPPPNLQPGVTEDMASEMRAIQRMPESQRDEAMRRFNARHMLSDAQRESLETFNDWKSEEIGRQVQTYQNMLNEEFNDTYSDDARLLEIMNQIPDEVLVELDSKMRRDGQNLHSLLDSSTGGGVNEDVLARLRIAKELEQVPYEERTQKRIDLRVQHFQERLDAEFDHWLYASDDEINAIIGQLSDEELKALDKAYGGQLQQKVEEATAPLLPQDLSGGLMLLSTPGLIMHCIDSSYQEQNSSLMGRIRNVTHDPDQAWEVNTDRVKASLNTIESELNGLWTSDATVMATLSSLNPEELLALQKQFEEKNGEGSFLEKLGTGIGGEQLAKATAMMANANDSVNKVDRQHEMYDQCRQIAVDRKIDELRRDPLNRNKTREELEALVWKDSYDEIEKSAQDGIKKIKTAANDIFKAMDGWGTDPDALHKALVGLSPEEAQLMKVEYRRHFGMDLDVHME
ncbi:MAG: hypothetical protein HN348_25510, partial [Proteobacteria bacterium]|nr:hypothetical protein [Pseudomonadota bacterium]